MARSTTGRSTGRGVSKTIHRTRLDQRFDRRTAALGRFDSFAKIKQVLETGRLASRSRQSLRPPCSTALDRRHGKVDFAVGHRKLDIGMIDAGGTTSISIRSQSSICSTSESLLVKFRPGISPVNNAAMNSTGSGFSDRRSARPRGRRQC